MAEEDPFVAALKALCAREGGYKRVAEMARISPANLSQILAGVKLPSGNPRGVGPAIRKALSETFPTWLSTSAEPLTAQEVVRGYAPTVVQAPNKLEPPGPAVSESQWALLEDFAMLPDEEKQILRARLAERARAAREEADNRYFKPNKMPAPVSNARVAEAFGAAPAAAKPSDYTRATPLPSPPKLDDKKEGT